MQVWHLAPVHASGWALLGEVSTKVVAVSPARFVRIEGAAPRGMRVHVRGGAGERVVVAFAPPTASTRSVVVECTLPVSGLAAVSVPQRTCEPMA